MISCILCQSPLAYERGQFGTDIVCMNAGHTWHQARPPTKEEKGKQREPKY